MLNPRVDFAFKKLFGDEKNKDLLMSLINAIVSEEDQVKDIRILNPYTFKSWDGAKLSILDIRATNESGKHYNIEMQITDELVYDKRSLYYWSKNYTEQLGAGDAFKVLRKTIGIHILNFNLMDEKDYHNTYWVMNPKSQKRAFKDFELHTIELEKFETDIHHVKTALDRWVTFLKKAHRLEKSKLPKEMREKSIEKALDVLTELYLTQDEREVYDARLKWLRDEAAAVEKAEIIARGEGVKEGFEQGQKIGIQKGEKIGIQKGEKIGIQKGQKLAIQEIVKKLKASGMSASEIAKII